jgi:hypothetical protein
MKTLRAGTIKRIVVNRRKLKAGAWDPLSIQTSQGAIPAFSVMILGPSSINYRPDRPLKCGAKVWVATKAEVKYHD